MFLFQFLAYFALVLSINAYGGSDKKQDYDSTRVDVDVRFNNQESDGIKSGKTHRCNGGKCHHHTLFQNAGLGYGQVHTNPQYNQPLINPAEHGSSSNYYGGHKHRNPGFHYADLVQGGHSPEFHHGGTGHDWRGHSQNFQHSSAWHSLHGDKLNSHGSTGNYQYQGGTGHENCKGHSQSYHQDGGSGHNFHGDKLDNQGSTDNYHHQEGSGHENCKGHSQNYHQGGGSGRHFHGDKLNNQGSTGNYHHHGGTGHENCKGHSYEYHHGGSQSHNSPNSEIDDLNGGEVLPGGDGRVHTETPGVDHTEARPDGAVQGFDTRSKPSRMNTKH